MSVILVIQCIFLGFLGILFHLFIKAKALKKRAEIANETFYFTLFIKKDWISIILSILTVVVSIMVIDEMIYFKPVIGNLIKFFFFAIGYMGSSILQFLLSKAEKQILDIIDKKTNIADSIIQKKEVDVEDLEGVENAKQALSGDLGDRPAHPKGPK